MTNPKIGRGINRVAFVGSYLPRQCGLATFTHDLCEAFAAAHPQTHCLAVPVNDREEGYDYPPRVRYEIHEKQLDTYLQAAEYLNLNNTDLVCLQHDFDTFGGPGGSHVLSLLRNTNAPVVTTLHAVPPDPQEEAMRVMRELAQISKRLVVMSRRGRDLLQNTYGVPPEKIDLIAHGIPDVPFVDPSFYKEQFDAEGKRVLMTFGLLSADKGIEQAIRALPKILERCPDVVYMVVGATHPQERQRDGEAYRFSLERLAESLGVEQHFKIYNRFVNPDELAQFIGAADIYLTPYLNPEQVTSGTLAYAVGAGKAIVSTPYGHAEELLADGRGCLVPFKDHNAIAKKVLTLFDNKAEHTAMRKRAYLHGREMVWDKTARHYMACFDKATDAHPSSLATATRMADHLPDDDLPLINLQHVLWLTDDTGILAHAQHAVPDYSGGYLTTDNAHGLTLASLLEQLAEEIIIDTSELTKRYFAFLHHAWDANAQRYRDWMPYDRQWPNGGGAAQITQACVWWAAGTALARCDDDGLLQLAGKLFEPCLTQAATLSELDAIAYTLIGLDEYTHRFSGDRAATTVRTHLAGQLFDCLKLNTTPDWHWFTPRFTPGSARLAHALIASGRGLHQPEMIAAGLRSLRWLVDLQSSEDGYFSPINPANTDTDSDNHTQHTHTAPQPADAYAMVAACLEAYRVTGDPHWENDATWAFEWFLGRNDSGTPLYDSASGGTRDALDNDRASDHQSAQATLAFQLALAELSLNQNITPQPAGEDPASKTESVLSFPS